MHYKNGRIAKQGDPVITIDYAGNVQVGLIFDLNTAASTCNAQLHRPLGCALPVTLAECYHAEDALSALELNQTRESREIAPLAPVLSRDTAHARTTQDAKTALLGAYSRAVEKLQRVGEMTALAYSAGFIFPDDQERGKRTGFQVFVKVCRYSEALLKSKPNTGGLLCEDHV